MKQKKYLKLQSPIYKIISYFILLNAPFLISLSVAEEYKSQISYENFKDVYFKGEIKYEDYYSFYNQFDLFFGIDDSLDKKGFRDLLFPLSSASIRKLYNDKLKQMSLKENYELEDAFLMKGFKRFMNNQEVKMN